MDHRRRTMLSKAMSVVHGVRSVVNRFLSVVWVLSVALPLLLSSCTLPAAGPTATPTPEPTATALPSATPIPVLLLVTEDEGGPLEAALQQWATRHGMELRLRSPAVVDGTGLALAEGVQAIVWVGGGFGPQVSGWAGGLPLVVVDPEGITAGGRLSTVGEPGARHDQVSFLAGVLAGLVSQTRSVGLITATGGEHEAVDRMAFVHGLRYGCAGCQLVESTAAGVRPETLAGGGVDVVSAVPGPAAEAGLSLSAEAGLWVVWTSEPPRGVAIERLAGGVRFAPEALVGQALETLLAGEEGRGWPYSVENGGIQLVGLNAAAVSPGRQRVLEATYQALAHGELDPGVDPATGEER
jgi:hypothetical protein